MFSNPSFLILLKTLFLFGLDLLSLSSFFFPKSLTCFGWTKVGGLSWYVCRQVCAGLWWSCCACACARTGEVLLSLSLELLLLLLLMCRLWLIPCALL